MKVFTKAILLLAICAGRVSDVSIPPDAGFEGRHDSDLLGGTVVLEAKVHIDSSANWANTL